jgi:hypothetical protein
MDLTSARNSAIDDAAPRKRVGCLRVQMPGGRTHAHNTSLSPKVIVEGERTRINTSPIWNL